MNNRRIFLFLLVIIWAIIFIVPTANAQQLEDVVYLKNGSKVRGTIIERIPGKTIKIRTRDWNVFVYPIDEVERIEKEPIEPIQTNEIIEPSYRPQPQNYPGTRITREYSVFGGAIGTPGGLNIVYGQAFKDYGFRLSAGYFSYILGFQVNGFRRLKPTPNFEHNINIVLGVSIINDESWQYIGVGYEINIDNFFGGIDIELGSGDRSTPQLGFQLGYLYRMK